MVTIETISLWSQTDQALADFTVVNTTETDGGGNEEEVILLTHNDEVYRFSPSYTDEELQEIVDRMNEEHQ